MLEMDLLEVQLQHVQTPVVQWLESYGRWQGGRTHPILPPLCVQTRPRGCVLPLIRLGLFLPIWEVQDLLFLGSLAEAKPRARGTMRDKALTEEKKF